MWPLEVIKKMNSHAQPKPPTAIRYVCKRCAKPLQLSGQRVCEQSAYNLRCVPKRLSV